MNNGSLHGSYQNRLKLPPFGKILLAYQEQRVRLNFSIYIHVGRGAQAICFDEVKNGFLASYLPENESFSSYQWPVYQQHIVLTDHGGLSLKELHKMCAYLLNHKPRLVYLWSEEHPCQFFKGATS